MPTVLVWFRRDLRLTDNPALAAAIERDAAVVAVYVHAPDDEGAWPAGAASRWWLDRSLRELDAALRARGLALTVRRGAAAPTLAALATETGASVAFWNRLSSSRIQALSVSRQRRSRLGMTPSKARVVS